MESYQRDALRVRQLYLRERRDSDPDQGRFPAIHGVFCYMKLRFGQYVTGDPHIRRHRPRAASTHQGKGKRGDAYISRGRPAIRDVNCGNKNHPNFPAPCVPPRRRHSGFGLLSYECHCVLARFRLGDARPGPLLTRSCLEATRFKPT